MKKHILVNIGCIECGVSTNIVGVFSSLETAKKIRDICEEKYEWREGGQNKFKIFDMPKIDMINKEYHVELKQE